MIFQDRFYTDMLTPPMPAFHPRSSKTESKTAQQNRVYIAYERGWPQTGTKPPLLRGGMEMRRQACCFWKRHPGPNSTVPAGGEAAESPQMPPPPTACSTRRERTRSERRLMGKICYDAESSLKDEHGGFLFFQANRRIFISYPQLFCHATIFPSMKQQTLCR